MDWSFKTNKTHYIKTQGGKNTKIVKIVYQGTVAKLCLILTVSKQFLNSII